MKKFIKNHKKISICLLMLLIIIISLGIYFLLFNKKEIKEEKTSKKKEPKIVEVKKIQILDENSKSRPYAVMINNHNQARPYHSGLQDAYIVYEIVVEGGITRMMALFKDKDTEKIGSVRSSRHYFLDYALENDAYYVHWGWSPQAQSDISRMGINNINGLTYEGVYFFRDKTLNVSSEHRGFTSMELLKQAVKKLNYRSETENDLLLNYSVDPVNISAMNNAQLANNISIPYSGYVTTSYEYDAENKVYNRVVNGEPHKDYITGNQYTAKNIITYKISNHTLAGDNKGRQDIDNIGSGDGYFITEGYAIPIKWTKSSRDSQTKYTFEDGKELQVNDGNTYIQIQPSNMELTFGE